MTATAAEAPARGLGRVELLLKRVGQVLCRHRYIVVFDGKSMYLCCHKCLRETQPFTVSNGRLISD